MARDYEKFNTEKETACKEIHEDNAQQMLLETKSKLLNKLRSLNIQDLRQVEDLYLIVAPLTQAASYVEAQDKAAKKNQSFEVALASIGTDDVLSRIAKTFEDLSSAEDFSKFKAIDNRYQPAKEAWAGLHARMDTAATTIMAEADLRQRQKTTNSLKTTVPQYLDHLKKKFEDYGIAVTDQLPTTQTPSKVINLINRYRAVDSIQQLLNKGEVLSGEDIKQVKESAQTCLKHKPNWSERPFLQKLTDILSLGFKPLYRAFTSQEKNYQTTINNTIDPPKMRG